MNYPDTYSARNADNYWSSAEDVLPADHDSIMNARAAYEECVRACVQVFKKHGFTYLSKEDVSWLGFANSIESTLEECVKQEIKNFEERGIDMTVRPDNHQELFDGLYAELKAKPAPTPQVLFDKLLEQRN